MLGYTPWDPQTSTKAFRWIFKVEDGLFQVHALIYPILLLATLYSWLLLPTRIFTHLKSRLQSKLKHENTDLLGKAWMKSGLVFTLMLSILLPLIPYCPSLNPYFKPASTDIRYYRKWLENMLGLDLRGALEYAFYGQSNRPLYLLLLYCLTGLGIPKDLVLNLEALLIAPMFALSVYLSAKRLSRNHLYAVLASLAGILGFNMTVSMAAGFFAAWAALTFFYVCIALVSSLDRRKTANLTALIIASLMILFIHPWTWSLLMTVLSLHLIFSSLRNLLNRRFSVDKWLLTALSVNIVVDFLKMSLAPQQGRLEAAMTNLDAGKFIAFEHLFDQVLFLRRLSTSYMGGSFYNPLHMTLALIGFLSILLKLREMSCQLLFIWITVVSLILPFSNLSAQAHLLYATPFPLLIAEGLWRCSHFLGKMNCKLSIWFQLFFLSSSLSYTLRILSNLV